MLENVPAAFDRAMDTVLARVNARPALHYLESVVMFVKSVAEYEQHIQVILQLKKNAIITTKLKKNFFFSDTIHCPGHVIKAGGLHTSFKTTEAVIQSTCQVTTSGLRFYLGPWCVYHRIVLKRLRRRRASQQAVGKMRSDAMRIKQRRNTEVTPLEWEDYNAPFFRFQKEMGTL